MRKNKNILYIRASDQPNMTRLKATGPCPGFASGPMGQHGMAHFISVSCRAEPARHGPLARYT
jgi:hypothetical protein